MTEAPLLIELVLTEALSTPALLGLFANVTVSDVLEAAVTVPVAPLSKVIVLLAAVESKPNPPITTVEALAVISPTELAVTAGITLATCTAEPLLIESVVTTVVSIPAIAGNVERETIIEVGVAEITVPVALLLNVITLSAAVVSKPNPAIVTLVEFAARSTVLLVTTGITLAT